MKVHDIDSYWDYLMDTYVPNMYSTAWYNGNRPLGLYGYFGDRVNLIIGYSVLRQLRVRKSKITKLVFLKIAQILPGRLYVYRDVQEVRSEKILANVLEPEL